MKRKNSHIIIPKELIAVRSSRPNDNYCYALCKKIENSILNLDEKNISEIISRNTNGRGIYNKDYIEKKKKQWGKEYIDFQKKTKEKLLYINFFIYNLKIYNQKLSSHLANGNNVNLNEDAKADKEELEMYFDDFSYYLKELEKSFTSLCGVVDKSAYLNFLKTDKLEIDNDKLIKSHLEVSKNILENVLEKKEVEGEKEPVFQPIKEEDEKTFLEKVELFFEKLFLFR